MEIMGTMDCRRECGRSECDMCGNREQKHVHEVIGSVELAETGRDAHNHRFAAVSGEAIPTGNGDHVHELCFRTDFHDGHFHEFSGRSGGAIDVGCGHHVHFAEARTNVEDRHSHCFKVASLIDDPIRGCKR